MNILKKVLSLGAVVLVAAALPLYAFAVPALGDAEAIMGPTRVVFGDNGPTQIIDPIHLQVTYNGGNSISTIQYTFGMKLNRYYKYNGRTYRLIGDADHVTLFQDYDQKILKNPDAIFLTEKNVIDITWTTYGLAPGRPQWNWISEYCYVIQEGGTQSPINITNSYFILQLMLEPVTLEDIYNEIGEIGDSQEQIEQKIESMITYVPTDAEKLQNVMNDLKGSVSSGNAIIDTLPSTNDIPHVDTENIVQANYAPVTAFFNRLTNLNTPFTTFLIGCIIVGIIIMIIQFARG